MRACVCGGMNESGYMCVSVRGCVHNCMSVCLAVWVRGCTCELEPVAGQLLWLALLVRWRVRVRAGLLVRAG